uniref:Uncharacterized protein n=1 Tax=Neogobius melanostomus TaxID=47308 RepID=A0A8C6V2K7_9GOBI
PPTAPPIVLKCRYGSKLCTDGSACVVFSHVCDGQWDCTDGSDEFCDGKEDCPDGSDENCPQKIKFTLCVSKSQVCNGRSDCHDGSDELNCASTAPTSTPSGGRQCPGTSKLCNDGSKCVLLSHICDGEDDCSDGSDELKCPNSCPEP